MTITMNDFRPPTLEEVKLQAAKSGLPEMEAEKFFCYYESVNWFVGKKKMSQWRMALAGWRLRWQERQSKRLPQKLSGAEIILHRDEMDRVTQRMKTIRNSYSDHQSWSDADLHAFQRLKSRRDELRKLLGVEY